MLVGWVGMGRCAGGLLVRLFACRVAYVCVCFSVCVFCLWLSRWWFLCLSVCLFAFFVCLFLSLFDCVGECLCV